MLANARLAEKHGATIHQNTPVCAIEQRGAQVIVRTENDEQLFDRAIVTAGAWMNSLLAHLALPLQVTRQQIVYLRAARNTAQFAPENFPVWIDAAALYYGFPSDGHIEGVKFASHARRR